MENIPETLEFRSLKITSCTINQKFRDKHPSLGYLPAGAEIQFVLADLNGIVSDDILKSVSQIIHNEIEPEPDQEEEKEKIFTEEDFPSFTSSFRKPKPKIKIEPNSFNEENFPSLNGTKKNNIKQQKGWLNISPKPDEPSKSETDFPSFSSVQINQKAKPKKWILNN